MVSDAIVEDTVRQLAFTTMPDGAKQLAPEGLYGRRKMLAATRRRLPGAGFGAVDRGDAIVGRGQCRSREGASDDDPGLASISCR